MTDIKGFSNLIDEMKKVILEDMYESAMDTHMQYGKNENRPEESDRYSLSLSNQSESLEKAEAKDKGKALLMLFKRD